MANQVPKRIKVAVPDVAAIVWHGWSEDSPITDTVRLCHDVGAKHVTEKMIEGKYAELDASFSAPWWIEFIKNLDNQGS